MSATAAPPQRAARRGRRGTRSRWNRAGFARNAARLLPWPTVTPLATAMVLLLLITALLLRTHPSDVNPVVAWASTNLHNLAHHPVAAMLVSMFVVTGNLLPELLIVAVSLAVLERTVGRSGPRSSRWPVRSWRRCSPSTALTWVRGGIR